MKQIQKTIVICDKEILLSFGHCWDFYDVDWNEYHFEFSLFKIEVSSWFCGIMLCNVGFSVQVL